MWGSILIVSQKVRAFVLVVLIHLVVLPFLIYGWDVHVGVIGSESSSVCREHQRRCRCVVWRDDWDVSWEVSSVSVGLWSSIPLVHAFLVVWRRFIN